MYDRVNLRIKAGDGGNGVVSFRREKYVPRGGPDGGDGGDGGNVVIMADESVTDLREFHEGGFYQAERGGHGEGKKKHGRNGTDLILKVPVGTVVFSRLDDSKLLADLEHNSQRVVVARGGDGGMGNTHFASSTNQAPRIAQKGEAGEDINIFLDLRLIADVGIIGFPNAGKSSLLAAASAAKPEIANYPFTTKQPVLGTVNVSDNIFVMAEIPGLIEGAHLGKGLGHEFLHHALRTRLLIHLVDGNSKSPLEDIETVNRELREFDLSLGTRAQIIAINKIDQPDVKKHVKQLKTEVNRSGLNPYFISAITGQGVPELMQIASQTLKNLPEPEMKPLIKIFRPVARHPRFKIHRTDQVFEIEAPELERMIQGPQGSEEDVIFYVRERLSRQGLDKELSRAGAQPGDRVRLGQLEWIWTKKKE